MPPFYTIQSDAYGSAVYILCTFVLSVFGSVNTVTITVTANTEYL